MKKIIVAAATAVSVMGLATAASADMTSVNCGEYLIAIADDIAIQGEIGLGSRTAFENEACARSEDLADGVESPRTVPVFIEEIDMSTRVLIVPLDDD